MVFSEEAVLIAEASRCSSWLRWYRFWIFSVRQSLAVVVILMGADRRKSNAAAQLSPSMKIETIYAQDPVFNNLDRQLLESLAIEVVQDPVAFSLVDRQTFLYSPGAERSHLVKMLPLSPALFFGGPLESNVSLKS